MALPEVDFSVYSLVREDRPSDEELADVSRKIRSALEQYHMLKLKNTGVDEEMFYQLFDTSRDFFDFPFSVKKKYHYKIKGTMPEGYLPISKNDSPDIEIHDIGRDEFNFAKLQVKKDWTDLGAAKEIVAQLDRWYNEGRKLALRVAECLGLALDLGRDYFLKNYLSGLVELRPDANWSVSKVNQYDPVKLKEIPGGEVYRFLPHCDFDFLTFLFVTKPGLQSELPNGDWLPVDPDPGSILLQSGSLLETLTSGKLKSDRHRVVARDTRELDQIRYSAVFFLEPDNDTTLDPIVSSKKTEHSQTVKEFIIGLFKDYVEKGVVNLPMEKTETPAS